MSTTMTQLRGDLWQTRTESPFPGLTTHAYLWQGPSGNILFYSPASDADFAAIEELGGRPPGQHLVGSQPPPGIVCRPWWIT